MLAGNMALRQRAARMPGDRGGASGGKGPTDLQQRAGRLTSWVYNPRTQGGQEMNYGRTVDKALYWAGIDGDEWFNMAEVKGIWSKVTHGEWNGSAGM